MEKLRNQGLTAGSTLVIGVKRFQLTKEEINQIKNEIIKEVKESEYGSNKVTKYITLDRFDIDLGYELRLPHIVKDGLTLDAHLMVILPMDENGDEVGIVNEEEIDTITIKLW